MKSNFAVIDRAVTDAIAHEPQLTAAQHAEAQAAGHVRLAGMEIYDENRVIAASDKMLNARGTLVERYLAAREDLANSLAERNITPLAFLPFPLWDELCQKSGLIQLRPDARSKVVLYTGGILARLGMIRLYEGTRSVPMATHFIAANDDAAKAENEYSPALRTAFPFAVIGGLLAGGFLANVVWPAHTVAWLAGLPIGLLIGGIVSAIYNMSPMGRLAEERDQTKRAERQKKESEREREEMVAFVREVFPGGKEADRKENVANKQLWSAYSKVPMTVHATLVLPPPPADVIAIMLRAAQRLPQSNTIEPQIAVVPEAIGFVETIPELMLATQTAQVAHHAAERLEALRQAAARMSDRDPIVFITDPNNRAVAVLAHYGEFAMEQEVVNLVIGAGLNLTDDT